jgi:hypothetical protein
MRDFSPSSPRRAQLPQGTFARHPQLIFSHFDQGQAIKIHLQDAGSLGTHSRLPITGASYWDLVDTPLSVAS